MSLSPRGMSVMEVYRIYRNNRLIVNRKYQRKLVWILEEKMALIESILKEYPIPLILIAEYPEGKYEIIDGIQRLNAIFGFIENEFPIMIDNNPVYFDVRLFPSAQDLMDEGVFIPTRGENFLLLAKEKNSAFLEYQLPITIFQAKNEKEIIETFRRINSYGKHLSPQEVRQAGVTTAFSQLVRELGAELRGDVSRDILPLTEMPEISIDSRKTKMGYGISAEETFWCEQGILVPSQLRDSEDEQFIADLALSIALKEPFPASREEFNHYYGKELPDKSSEIENAVGRYGGPENLKKDIKIVFSEIKEMVGNYLRDKRLKNILNSKTGSNPVKEPFYTLFMAMYELMIIDEKKPFDVEKIFEAIYDISSKTKTPSHYATTKNRRKNIDVCKGLIHDYFKKSDSIDRSSGTLSIDFENYLKRSATEASRYDFKQGFYSLDESIREFNQNMVEKILDNIAAIANLGTNQIGYLFIGVTDKEEDTKKIEKLDKISRVPRIGHYGVVGLEREAKLRGISLDNYLNIIYKEIRNSDLPEWLKTQLNTGAIPLTYRGFTVLMIKIKAGKEPVWHKGKMYIRDGPNCMDVVGPKIGSVYALFNT
jgi:hypothetical protein